MAKWQKFDLKIPKSLGSAERQAIAEDVIDFIIERTRSGFDVNWKRFPSYSKDYKKSLDFKLAGKKSKPVNLTLSGELLDSIKVLDNKPGKITIGFDRNDNELNAKAEGNQLGTYGNLEPIPGKARKFLGIAEEDFKKILKKYQTSDGLEKAKEALAASFIAKEIVGEEPINVDAIIERFASSTKSSTEFLEFKLKK
ncbi:MAG: hypothetical protein QW818_02505 [Candidatus Aenigmatarchaeota archaeon]